MSSNRGVKVILNYQNNVSSKSDLSSRDPSDGSIFSCDGLPSDVESRESSPSAGSEKAPVNPEASIWVGDEHALTGCQLGIRLARLTEVYCTLDETIQEIVVEVDRLQMLSRRAETTMRPERNLDHHVDKVEIIIKKEEDRAALEKINELPKHIEALEKTKNVLIYLRDDYEKRKQTTNLVIGLKALEQLHQDMQKMIEFVNKISAVTDELGRHKDQSNEKCFSPEQKLMLEEKIQVVAQWQQLHKRRTRRQRVESLDVEQSFVVMTADVEQSAATAMTALHALLEDPSLGYSVKFMANAMESFETHMGKLRGKIDSMAVKKNRDLGLTQPTNPFYLEKDLVEVKDIIARNKEISDELEGVVRDMAYSEMVMDVLKGMILTKEEHIKHFEKQKGDQLFLIEVLKDAIATFKWYLEKEFNYHTVLDDRYAALTNLYKTAYMRVFAPSAKSQPAAAPARLFSVKPNMMARLESQNNRPFEVGVVAVQPQKPVLCSRVVNPASEMVAHNPAGFFPMDEEFREEFVRVVSHPPLNTASRHRLERKPEVHHEELRTGAYRDPSPLHALMSARTNTPQASEGVDKLSDRVRMMSSHSR